HAAHAAHELPDEVRWAGVPGARPDGPDRVHRPPGDAQPGLGEPQGAARAAAGGQAAPQPEVQPHARPVADRRLQPPLGPRAPGVVRARLRAAGRLRGDPRGARVDDAGPEPRAARAPAAPAADPGPRQGAPAAPGRAGAHPGDGELVTAVAPIRDAPRGAAARLGAGVRGGAALLRVHWLVALLLAGGAVLRGITFMAYRPALIYQDSVYYLHDAAHLAPDMRKPALCPAFLRILPIAHELAVVPFVQHVLI